MAQTGAQDSTTHEYIPLRPAEGDSQMISSTHMYTRHFQPSKRRQTTTPPDDNLRPSYKNTPNPHRPNPPSPAFQVCRVLHIRNWLRRSREDSAQRPCTLVRQRTTFCHTYKGHRYLRYPLSQTCIDHSHLPGTILGLTHVQKIHQACITCPKDPPSLHHMVMNTDNMELSHRPDQDTRTVSSDELHGMSC